jgi:hypothetical protein
MKAKGQPRNTRGCVTQNNTADESTVSEQQGVVAGHNGRSAQEIEVFHDPNKT